MRAWIAGLLLIAGSLTPWTAGAVQELQRLDRHINDVANVLTEDHRQQLRRELAALQASTGVEVTVVIINQITDHQTTAAPAAIFAEQLLASWQVGAQSGDGVLILVVKNNALAHIALGHGFGRLHRSLMDGVVEDKMLPHLRSSTPKRAVHDGVFGVVGVLTKKTTWLRHFQWQLVLGIFLTACVVAGVSIIRSGRKGWGWIYFSVLLFIVVIAFKILSYRTHRYGGWGGGSHGSWS
jgi:uncharacterized membrane protein YgcG